jgi:hypothetical protein
MKTANNLTLWETPSHYYGTEWPEYYTVVAQTRDSEALDRSNFDATLKALGGESKHTNAVIVARASHWACGWVEVLLVHKSASKKVAIADEIKRKLEDYPIVDEFLFSDYEQEEKQQIWSILSLKERIQLCVQANYPCVGARHDYIPGDVDMYIEV